MHRKTKNQRGGAETENVGTILCTNDKDESVGVSGTQPDLLAIIWKSLQEDRERNEKIRKLDEEKNEKNRKLDEERWEKFADKLTSQFRSEVDKLNESISQRFEQETDRLSQEISAVKTQTQQEILDVNCKLDRVHESVNEKLKVHMEKARLEHVKVSKEVESRIDANITSKLDEYRTEVEKNLGAVRKEVSDLKQKVAERETTANLEEITIRLDSLQEQVTVASRQVEPVSGNSQTPLTNVTAGAEQGSCSYRIVDLGESHVRNSQGSVNGCRMNENIPVLCNVTNSDINLSNTHEFVNRGLDQCHGNVLNDLILPKFADCHKQNVVHFLAELDAYFNLKNVPEPLRLPLAMKAVTDGYAKQWFTAIYKDLVSYEHFKRAITELLWNPQIQSRTRCALYQDRFDKGKDESMSAHFLRYSVITANLSPRLSELDLIDAISGHFPLYVQRAILSANVRTIQEALSFLNKLEAMEDGERNRGSNPGPQNSNGNRANCNGNSGNYHNRYDKNRQGGHHVRNFGYRGNHNFNHGRQDDRFNQRYESPANRQRDNTESHATSQGEQTRGGLNPQANSYNPNRFSTHPTNHGENRTLAGN
jgi:hypothetical protein